MRHAHRRALLVYARGGHFQRAHIEGRSNLSFILLQLITSLKTSLSQRLFIVWQAQAPCEIAPEHAECA